MNKKYDKILDEMIREQTLKSVKEILYDLYGAKLLSVNDESIPTNGYFDYTFQRGETIKKIEGEKTSYYWTTKNSEYNGTSQLPFVDFAKRKLEHNIADIFIIIDDLNRYAFIISREKLFKNCKFIQKDTRYRDNEDFARIETKYGSIIKKDKLNDKWIKEV